MKRQTDYKVAAIKLQGDKDRFENLVDCSFKKGFHSPDNQRELANMQKELKQHIKITPT